ncbi:hypothetical protein TrCOL_g5130 [Triparma columacea]|uniref:Branched-chain-amino-acid aminotransferase n=2 Tax=Triparma columacea TaxID=722753 RepID=A0A9W7L7A7_9STRA|nr:hypothetical protein TrCOL_g5130 [Triparma columacea]
MYLHTVNATTALSTFDGSGGGTDQLASGWNTGGGIIPHGPLPLPPSATVLNYGQGLFEGLKAFRREDGKIVIFRPYKNAERCRSGCTRLLIPPVPDDVFVSAVKQCVRANAQYVPPYRQGALYLRPLVFGSGAKLGVSASDEFTLCVWCSPVGNYFGGGGKGGVEDVPPITLLASNVYRRSCEGGVGGTKFIGNYAAVFKCQSETKMKGFNEALFLDANTGRGIEEAGASNFFAVLEKGGKKTLVTPGLDKGTILPGVTRDTVIRVAREVLGITVEERRLSLDELGSCVEAFCCGTGASLTPVGEVVEEIGEGEEKKYKCWRGERKAGEITRRIYDVIQGIMWGDGEEEIEEKYGEWVEVVEPEE